MTDQDAKYYKKNSAITKLLCLRVYDIYFCNLFGFRIQNMFGGSFSLHLNFFESFYVYYVHNDFAVFALELYELKRAHLG
jgi:hypothetical protein